MGVFSEGRHGVAGDEHVGPGGKALDGIRTVRVSEIIMGRRGAAQVATRGKAQDTDLFIAQGTRRADGAGGVRPGGQAVAGHHAVIQHKGGNALAVQHPGNGRAFVIGLHAITTAGTDDDRASRSLRGKDGQRRLGLVRAVGGVRRFPFPEPYFFFHAYLSPSRTNRFHPSYFTPFWTDSQDGAAKSHPERIRTQVQASE